jgi:hypothetical protein
VSDGKKCHAFAIQLANVKDYCNGIGGGRTALAPTSLLVNYLHYICAPPGDIMADAPPLSIGQPDELSSLDYLMHRGKEHPATSAEDGPNGRDGASS